MTVGKTASFETQRHVSDPNLYQNVETEVSEYSAGSSEEKLVAGAPTLLPVIKFLADIAAISAIYGTVLLTPIEHNAGSEGSALGELFDGLKSGSTNLGEIPVDLIVGNLDSFAVITPISGHEGHFNNFGQLQSPNHSKQYVGALVTNTHTVFLTADTFLQFTGFDHKELPHIARPPKFSPETSDDADVEIERLKRVRESGQAKELFEILGLDSDRAIEEWVKGIQILPGKDRIKFSINEDVTSSGGGERKEGSELTKAIEDKLRESELNETIVISGDESVNPDVLAPEGMPTYEIRKSPRFRGVPGTENRYDFRRADGEDVELKVWSSDTNLWQDHHSTVVAKDGRHVEFEGIQVYLPQSASKVAKEFRESIETIGTDGFVSAMSALHPKDLSNAQRRTLSAHFDSLYREDNVSGRSSAEGNRLSFLAWLAGVQAFPGTHKAFANHNISWDSSTELQHIGFFVDSIRDHVDSFGNSLELTDYLSALRSRLLPSEDPRSPFDGTLLNNLGDRESVIESLDSAKVRLDDQIDYLQKREAITFVLNSAGLDGEADAVLDGLSANRNLSVTELLIPVFANAKQARATYTEGIPAIGAPVERKAELLYPILPEYLKSHLIDERSLDYEVQDAFAQWVYHRDGGNMFLIGDEVYIPTDRTDRIAAFLFFFAKEMLPNDDTVIHLENGESVSISKDMTLRDILEVMQKNGLDAAWGDDGQDPDDLDYVPPQE